MMRLFSDIRENRLLSVLVFLLIALAVVFGYAVRSEDPAWIINGLGVSEAALPKYEALKILGIGMGGILIAIQAAIANKRAKAMQQTAEAQADAANAQAKATEEQAKANENTEQGQRQERLKNAIEHLGHTSDSVRLGGAYELFHLARDTEELRQTVLDILCAHIRRTTGESEYRAKHKSKPSEEVQSLLTLLFVQDHEVFENMHINLQGSWLNGTGLERARLHKAVLTKAHLQGARLCGAHLDGALLVEAQLQKADLTGVHMKRAMIVEARLQSAILVGAHLEGSILNCAHMHGAILLGAYLQETGLNGTRLHGANLAVARLQLASLGGAYLQGADLHMTGLHGAVLRDAQMQGAYLGAAELHEARFSSLQGGRHLFSEQDRQEINPEPAQLQGISSSVSGLGPFREQLTERKDIETDLSGVIFSGGLTEQDVDSFVTGLSEAGAWKLREKLQPHIGPPVSHELPEDSGAVTGTYTEEEAERWIAEYEQAMSEVPEDDS